MRKLTRKQLLARLFAGFFAIGSMLCTVNSAVAGGPTYGKYYYNNEPSECPFDCEIRKADSNNIINLTITGPDNPAPDIYSGYTDSNGNVENNKLTITTNEGVATELSNVYGGYTNIGNATQNIIDIAGSTINGDVYGGKVGTDTTGIGNAVSNTIIIKDSDVSDSTIYGGYTNNGDANSNTVEITNSKTATVWGGYIMSESATGNTNSNTLKLTDSEVYGSNIVAAYNQGTGDAVENTIKINGGTIEGTLIAGADVGTGSAILNKVTLSGCSSVTCEQILGGFVTGENGKAYSNAVTLDNIEKLNAYWVAGGYVKSGEAASNTVTINNSIINGRRLNNYAVLGGGVSTGGAIQNEVTISGGTINGYVYGGFAENGDTEQNIVRINDGSKVNAVVYRDNLSDVKVIGGYVYGNGKATNNRVELNGASYVNGAYNPDSSGTLVSDANVYGGYVGGNGKVANNTVIISGASSIKGASGVDGSGNNMVSSGKAYGGYIKNGDATENAVEISDKSTLDEAYGGFVNNDGDATNNTVKLSGASTVSGSVYGGKVNGTGDAKTGNKLIISGAGNTIGGQIVNFETMTFDAADVKKDETMLSLTTESSFTFGVESIETNNANLAVGEKITLISSKVDNVYDGITFKIDGKQAIRDGNNFIANVAKEDSDKVVHVNEYAYEYNTSDYKLNLCNNSGFITGLYIDAEGAKQLGKAEMTVSSVPENVTEIYGAYSEDADVVAGGATINLETTELSDVDLIGSYNLKDETQVDTSKNTLNVNVSGVKVNSVDGFGNMNFKLASDENAMLEVKVSDGFVMNGMNFNSILPEDGLEGTKTIIKVNGINAEGAKFKINDEEVGSTKTLTITTRNSDSVVYGTYTYGISSEIITLTGKSIVSAVNINSGETKAADNNTLKVTGKMVEKYTELYGAFNADGGAATDAVVDLSEAVSNENLTIYGGYSTGSGADVTTGNVLNVSKNGNKVKNILNFSTLDFTLGSDIAAGTTMLSTVDKVALGGVSVNTEMSGIALAKGEKIVLLYNADKGNAELKLNGSTGDQTVAEENSSFVAVSSVGYNTNDNKIAIECKDAFAAGCYIDEKGKLGKDTLTLGSSAASNMRAGYERASEAAPDMSKYSDIYGVYSAGEKDPTDPVTVNIVSAIDYSNTVLHGGYKNGNRYAKNTKLIIDSLNVKLKGVTDFETMTFNLPAETKNGDTMLKVADAVDMAPTKSVGVEASKATGLKAGDSVNLIDSDAGIKNFGTQKVTVSGLTDKTGEVKVDDKALVLALDKNGEKPNKNTKAPVEAVSATMALVNQASALASSKLNKSMTAAVASANGDSATFASMNGGHSKYETGSYVEADSWNIGVGIAKKGMSKKNPDTTYGLFFQYGKSSFDTHNDGGFRGDGDSKMFGAGLMFHQEARSRYYYHGNVFAGKVDAKWNCAEGGYDDKATYYGMTFGMGRKHNAGGNKTMDIYGRYSFNHVGSMNGDLNGLKYDFDSTSSHNLRLGLRMEYAKKNSATAYWGLAWEHEFAGASGATLTTPNIVERTASPSLKGDSGIAEVGYQWKRGNWEYNINAEGSFGKREGVTGSFNINYNF